ncbi:Farnesyl diphosphate synthase [Sphingobacterium spiritivorum]|uniref:Farnesyl diphosphate synthase n=1 Tax=Sphingobacterium spiritivorum TaxID=258 RepID=A0A380B9G5_SPHSI|nr:polyprenyl synthetase family protein [Sphingobacterium spiritivorum]SUI96836.1 Farnesyl diphosphate synthase [Sphingobacterium spiritivorum]
MNTTLTLSRYVQEALTSAVFPQEPANMYDPIRYILTLKGKQVRPVLTLMGAQLFGEEDMEKVVPAALAIEYFHNFSLIHDDIMDKAPLRRGQLTVHEKWNDSVAILSGDGLLVKAYEQVAKCPKENLLDLLTTFNKVATEVCEGQQLDMDFESLDQVTEDEYLHMIRLKTSVLLGGALRMGAIIAQASVEQQELIYDFGVNVGIAFQLQDDILDVYGDPETFGKQVGGDIIANKKTFLLIKLLEHASVTDLAHIQDLLTADLDQQPDKVELMKQFYAKYDISTLANRKKEYFTTLAFDTLAKINVPSERKAELIKLAENLLNRIQ